MEYAYYRIAKNVGINISPSELWMVSVRILLSNVLSDKEIEKIHRLSL